MEKVNYADADVVIVHAGTCDLKKQSDPEEQGRSGIIIVGWLASQKGPDQSVADNF